MQYPGLTASVFTKFQISMLAGIKYSGTAFCERICFADFSVWSLAFHAEYYSSHQVSSQHKVCLKLDLLAG